MNRRALLSSFAPLALVACTTGGSPTIDLPTAKIWANEITAAILSFADQALAPGSGLVPATMQSVVQQAVDSVKAANTVFQGLQPGDGKLNTVATQVVTALTQLLGLLTPIFPVLDATGPVGMGVHLGLMVLTAFVNSIAMVVPPVPAALHRAALSYHKH